MSEGEVITIDEKVINISDKLIKRDKKRNAKKYIKSNRTKEIAKLLIDLCEGDFAIVFKSEDMKKHFDGSVGRKDFLVAMTDVEKRDHNHPDYFFKNFGCSRQYFNLKGK